MKCSPAAQPTVSYEPEYCNRCARCTLSKRWHGTPPATTVGRYTTATCSKSRRLGSRNIPVVTCPSLNWLGRCTFQSEISRSCSRYCDAHCNIVHANSVDNPTNNNPTIWSLAVFQDMTSEFEIASNIGHSEVAREILLTQLIGRLAGPIPDKVSEKRHTVFSGYALFVQLLIQQ